MTAPASMATPTIHPALRAVPSRPTVRIALTWFVVSRVVVLALIALLHALHRLPDGNAAFRTLTHFDGDHYLRIARIGYFATHDGRPLYDEAFLPGFPLMIRGLGMLLGLRLHPGFTALAVASVLIAWGAALVAGVLLAELVAPWGPAAQRCACISLFLAPTGVFLVGVYTEAPFLALTLGCFLLARRGRWLPAALVLGWAASIRISALFLVPMLCLELVRQRRRVADWWWRAACSVLIVCAAPMAYWAWLTARTHRPRYWFEVQNVGYGRETRPLPYTISRTIRLARRGADINDPASRVHWFVHYQAGLELLAVVLFALAVVRLLWVREWGLAIFALVTLASLSQGPVFLSVPRNILDCFPVLVVLALAVARCRPPVRWLLLGLSAACMVLTSSTFLVSHWSG